MTILLIEDEQAIRQFVSTALQTENHEVTESSSVQQGLEKASQHHPSLVILDLGLPDADGIQFIQTFRDWSSAPILVLSARGEEHQKIASLDAGADDYLTKPFAIGELLARVRALLRRSNPHSDKMASALTFENITIDLSRRIVTRDGDLIHLTPTEYRLLSILVTHAGKVMTHRQLLKEVWGNGNTDRAHYLRIYIGHLRHKLETDPAKPRHLLTETAIGYRFVL